MTHPTWVKSSRCESSSCVEVAAPDGRVLLRDSTHRVLALGAESWRDFLDGARAGEFDLG